MLAHVAARVASELDFITLGLAVISVCHLLRVGEVSSIGCRDISTVRRISFYHSKCANCWVTVPMGVWGEAWRSGPTIYPSRRVPPYCSPECGPFFGDQPPTRRDGMHGDPLGPPCSPGQALHSPSSLSGVGGSVNDKLGTIRHCRYHGMSPSPSTFRGPMENEGWSYVPRRRSKSGPRTCYPWSRVPSQNHRPSPWSGTTAMTTSHPPH